MQNWFSLMRTFKRAIILKRFNLSWIKKYLINKYNDQKYVIWWKHFHNWFRYLKWKKLIFIMQDKFSNNDLFY